MGNKYPKTMVDAGRQDVIFAVNSNVRPLSEDEYEKTPPMTGLAPWSSYQLNFADSAKQTGGSGNIEVNHVADVKARTNAMIPLIMQEEAKKMSGTDNGKSDYTAILETKVLFLPKEMSEDKGQSALYLAKKYPISLLKAATDNLQAAADKGGKYAAGNQKQAKAMKMATVVVSGEHIIESEVQGYESYTGRKVADVFKEDMTNAAKFTGCLKNSGTDDFEYCNVIYTLLKQDKKNIKYLDADTSSVSQSQKYVIYHPVLKTPNTSKVDENGLTKAYELAVYCDPSHLPYPFKVQLSTMKGRPIKDQKVGVQAGTITDRKTFTIDLTSWEWTNMVDRMDWEKNLILMFNHKKAFEAMEKFDAENRRASMGE